MDESRDTPRAPSRRRLTAALIWAIVLALAAASPAAARVVVKSPLTHHREALPGDRYEGRVELHNPSPEPARIRVYARDYSFQADGTTEYGPPGRDPRSNAPWIVLSSDVVLVPPGGDSAVTYRVTVPADRALTGSYWSVLMVEPAATEPRRAGDQGVAVHTVFRYAIQVSTDVGEGARQELELSAVELAERDGRPVLAVDVANPGQLRLQPTVWVDLFDSDGRTVGRLDAGKLRLYPGCSGRFRAPLEAVPPGAYRALVVADAGGDDLYGVELELGVD